MNITPQSAVTAAAAPPDPIAVARGLIAEAMARGAAMPDLVALDLAAAWDDLDDPASLPEIVRAPDDSGITPAELLLRARIVLRRAIGSITPAPRALRLASAIRHLDATLGRLDGWTDTGRDSWQ